MEIISVESLVNTSGTLFYPVTSAGRDQIKLATIMRIRWQFLIAHEYGIHPNV